MRPLAALTLALAGAVQAPPDAGRAPLELLSARALDGADRTTLLIVVRNRSAQPVEIRDLKIAGVPLAAHLEPADPRNPRSPGRGVDWYDVRPRTLPPGGAGAILLGYVARALREPALDLRAVTSAGEADLSCPAPPPETLKVACAAFSADLRTLTVLLRNDGPAPAALGAVEFNGRTVPARLRGSPVPPGHLAALELDVAAAYAEPCVLRVDGSAGRATAAFRAFPAESLNYPFWGQHADRRDLAEKNMDVHVTRLEGNAQVAEEIERHGGRMPETLERNLARRAAEFGRAPGAWAWYMQDDAGWGRPRPQTLLELGAFLRERGSPQPQFVCNPADLRRYAWTHDLYMNYHYHVTGESPDPAVFGGERSLDEIRTLNEPAPVLYLVDAVGQASRWITPAEEELASYAMLGRGARLFGWFLVPSVWDQGTTLHGGIDPLETRPWRYQEGATACVPVWNLIGEIAGFLKALQPLVAASAPFGGRLRRDGLEVLPVLCRDELLIVVLLNRRLRCTYPRHFPDGSSWGGIELKPHRGVTVTPPLPPALGPIGRVLAFDHDRGFRDVPFRLEAGKLSLDVDAVDTATVLLAGAPEAIERIRADASGRLKGAARGNPVRPHAVFTPRDASPASWADPSRTSRAEIRIAGPRPAGSWIRAALPRDPSSLGFFNPHSVTAFASSAALEAKVDCFRPVYRPAEGARPWSVSGGDANASLEADPEGLRIVSRWKDGRYGTVRLGAALDPRYDVLEIRREIAGRLEPILHLQSGSRSRAVNLRAALEGNPRSAGELVPGVEGRLPLSRIHWRALPGADDPGVTSAALGAQIYEGVYRFGEIRQARSAPLVYVRLPREVRAGETFLAHVYWHDAPFPPEDTPFLPETQRPADAADAEVGPAEGFGLAAADAGGITLQAQAECAWIEARDAEGRLLGGEALRTSDGRRWTWRARPAGAPVRAYAASASGRVVAVDLERPPEAPRLRELVRVAGQVESLACAPDGKFLVVGADRVYAFDGEGRSRWTFDLGENRRQAPRTGPGRNVDRVAVRPDGSVEASTFRFDEKSRRYENAVTVILSPDGKEQGRIPYDWKGAGAPRDPDPWPPYSLHRFRLADGSRVAATTQGLVQRLGAGGAPVWEIRRPGRIDAAILLEDRGRLVLAWKRYPHRYDWQCVPTLEVLSLADGSTLRRAEGVPHDDFGHFGTDLRLAAARDGRIFLGDASGRVYVEP